MNTECLRIADQTRRAFEGKAWHGPSLKELLDGVTPEQANARPIAGANSIWDLVLHIEFWTRAALQAANGVAMPKMAGTASGDWEPVKDASTVAWSEAKNKMFQTCGQLGRAIEQFGDSRLTETVPGRQYDFYYLFHGIVQHSLYHGGQIALLKRALS
ncbi:MAG TPA: DinB family protein [Candidatus Angelobacter sp.]|nr:DinB family protein [Candidatus Angelobacter sp.]